MNVTQQTYSNEDEVILAWMEKNYPEQKDNLELARILYKKMVKKEKFEQRKNEPRTIRKIAELEVGQRDTIRGIVAEVDYRSYIGCAKCKRKVCEHGEPQVQYQVLSALIGDETGNIWISKIAENVEQLDVGDEVEVYGLTKMFKDNLEMMVNNLRVLEKARIKEIKTFLAQAGTVKNSIMESLLTEHGVSKAELEQFADYNKKKDEWSLKEAIE
jgi:hypothetical protein